MRTRNKSGASISLLRPGFVIAGLPLLRHPRTVSLPAAPHQTSKPPPPQLAPATAASGESQNMKFAGWYLKIAAVGASIGAAMELFMIHTGFYEKVTVLESEKLAWESSPEAQAMREALNPWRKHDEQQQEK